ncbi:cytochrome d ubiquinol oxidase subunit II [Oecophyllibacter saccharovorans]|uniref:Cytochrome d ubiquinol oxidase subunit II n=1 Tax=Oecophyllibacter saccharovorans TaxID=2558360 RepID=A0A506UKD2_9PROT|nr:cytochrome d ubiquinol oxidase subunit II [Oecophyllibacter saccharovorans]QDH14970.1 cytochrome d ubiquinol oxidase subunit II [Oecophyllibacter saccharovorans]TPW33811.1 cytochrome d ubiquinol oxidase subunit II [Oecophyllibacter saccharovorans]TPW35155.1 cytochrome d ubiquinol oxidase subunit II [Oecophyllibacter saccharovorans]
MTCYVVFKLIWTGLLGVLLSLVGLMVGMDMGVGTLLRWVGRNNEERREALNIIGPHWEGNQVWFVLGGGAVFAAFPTLYGTSFSVFYIVMILLLFSMILRPVAFDYRSKVNSATWRDWWDWAFFISGFVPMFIFGAAMGNVLEGVGYHFLWDGQYIQDENFLSYLFNPFAILCGLMSVALGIQGGGAILMIHGIQPIYGRARAAAVPAGIIAAILFVIGGFWVSRINGFHMINKVDMSMPANPLYGQEVGRGVGDLLLNFHHFPILWALPAMALFGMLGSSLMLRANKPLVAWWLGVFTWLGTIGTVGAALFPFLMPSTTAPNQSLSAWNATGSEYGLICMALVAAIFVPTIFCYTAWSYWVTRGKVTPKTVAEDSHSY